MKRWIWWASWLPSALGIFIILASARWKLTRSPFYVAEWTRIGYSDSALLGIGILQVTCLVLYLIPRTAVLGAILLTGYLGGAVATHVRVGAGVFPIVFAIVFGVLLWGGLYLRDPRVSALIPLSD